MTAHHPKGLCAQSQPANLCVWKRFGSPLPHHSHNPALRILSAMMDMSWLPSSYHQSVRTDLPREGLSLIKTFIQILSHYISIFHYIVNTIPLDMVGSWRFHGNSLLEYYNLPLCWVVKSPFHPPTVVFDICLANYTTMEPGEFSQV